jgi:hypothetical protein
MGAQNENAKKLTGANTLILQKDIQLRTANARSNNVIDKFETLMPTLNQMSITPSTRLVVGNTTHAVDASVVLNQLGDLVSALKLSIEAPTTTFTEDELIPVILSADQAVAHEAAYGPPLPCTSVDLPNHRHQREHRVGHNA